MLRLFTTSLIFGFGVGFGFIAGPRIGNSVDNKRQKLLSKCSSKFVPTAQYQLVTDIVLTTTTGQKVTINNQPIQKVNFSIAAV